MATGDTITGSLADSLPTVIASARQIREQEGVMPQLCDQETLDEGTGLSWHEIALAALTAQAITESTDLNNPQQISDTKFTITPTVVGIETFITDRVADRISKKSYAKIGGLVQNAIQRKKDEDGLTMLDAATTSLGGAGTTLTTGHVGAAVVQISSNETEIGLPPFRCVLHGFQIHDFTNELVAGVGTYPTPEGLTARVFTENFRGMCHGAQVYEDGNITIDSSDDSKGGVFAQAGIVLVQGRAPRVIPVRKENIGGGGTALYHYDEYAYGERSAGHWVFELYSDATAPTS